MRSSIIGGAGGLLVLPLLALTTAVGVAGTASADPTECEPNTSWISVTNVKSPWRLTHIARYGVAPGTSISTTWEADSSAKITSGITKYGEATVKVGGVIAEAEAKAGVNLAKAEESTTTERVSQQVSFSPAKKKRVYAYFRAYRKYNGDFDKYRCSSDGRSKTKVAYGDWRSFRSGIYAQETTLCKRGSEWLGKKAGSLDAMACNAIR